MYRERPSGTPAAKLAAPGRQRPIQGSPRDAGAGGRVAEARGRRAILRGRALHTGVQDGVALRGPARAVAVTGAADTDPDGAEAVGRRATAGEVLGLALVTGTLLAGGVGPAGTRRG